jgi:hypothetical protein
MSLANRIRESARMLMLRRIFPVWWKWGRSRPAPWSREERLTVVLLSYGRPRNMAAITAACVACPFIHRIVLSNHNPAIDIRRFVRTSDPRVEIIAQPARCYPSKRYTLARETGDRWILCIDDDTFLAPRQILALFEALLLDSSVPHGIAGENFRPGGSPAEYVFGSPGTPETVDCLVWAYAFTRDHVTRYFELLDMLGIDNEDLQANEDIVLSLSGRGRPLVHNFGTLHLCDSREAEHVATSKQPGFREQRENLLRKVVALGARSL